jgi:hypothetical protein
MNVEEFSWVIANKGARLFAAMIAKGKGSMSEMDEEGAIEYEIESFIIGPYR